MAKKKSTLSLFSGAMGLDLGLENFGFHTVAAVEKNSAALKTIKANRPDIHLYNDIETVVSSEILKKLKRDAGEITLVSGGPCCQSFSTVGNREALSDPRGNLFYYFLKIVAETRPRFFVMENVKGILSAAVKHRPLNGRGPGNPPLSEDEQLGSALKVILGEFKKLDYYVKFGLVNCANYGVPQNRWRVIFLGSRDGEDICWPEPTHSKEGKDGKKRWVTLGQTLSKIKDKNPEFIPFPKDRIELLEMLTEGQNWTDLPENLQKQALGAAYESWGGRGGYCRRLKRSNPAPTLTTSPNGRATTLCHPTELRPLSIREYARLQQFPVTWKFKGSLQQRYTQIGNAVPVGLGEAIGRALNKTIRRTGRLGVPKDAEQRKGIVVCVDPALEKRVLDRKRKTQLHPPRLLNTEDKTEILAWLAASATSS